MQKFQNIQEYAVPNMQKICTICTNEICKIYVLYASIYKNMQITNMHYMQISICIYMQNMQKYAKLNMHKYAF